MPNASRLTDAAYALYEEFLRREAFWWAVDGRGYPVEKAGKVFLGLGRSATYKVRDELSGFDTGESTPPLEWFRSEAERGIREGWIGRGYDTTPSQKADAFFTALAGGKDAVDELRDRVAARGGDVMFGRVPRRGWIDRHVNHYLIVGNLLLR
jgi:hypothetical protein